MSPVEVKGLGQPRGGCEKEDHERADSTNGLNEPVGLASSEVIQRTRTLGCAGRAIGAIGLATNPQSGLLLAEPRARKLVAQY